VDTSIQYLAWFRAWQAAFLAGGFGGPNAPKPAGIGTGVPGTPRNLALFPALPVNEPRVWLLLRGTGACVQAADSENLLPNSGGGLWQAVQPLGGHIGFQPLDTLQVVNVAGTTHARFWWQGSMFLDVIIGAGGTGTAAAPGSTGCGTITCLVIPDPGA